MLSPRILFIGLVIAGASSYPYGEQQLLNAPVFNFPQEYRHPEQRPVLYSKQFHYFVAPEEAETYDEVIPESLLKKNVRVVVIKAPENKRITAAIARLAKTLAEEKTAIYVLNKEPDLQELTTQIDRLKEKKTEKPEVHFVKYKTAEEAELAAINIHSQYESLAGPSEVSGEETAPLHSYVGALNSEALDAKSESSILRSSVETLGDSPLYIPLPVTNVQAVDRAVEIKINPQVVPSSTDGIAQQLVVSTTLSPLSDVSITGVTSSYLPPVESGKYLPPVNGKTSSYLPPDDVSVFMGKDLSPASDKATDVTTSYLPPDDKSVLSGQYLPPKNDQGTKKRSAKSVTENVEKKVK